jgi:hypothetical protein
MFNFFVLFIVVVFIVFFMVVFVVVVVVVFVFVVVVVVVVVVVDKVVGIHDVAAGGAFDGVHEVVVDVVGVVGIIILE